MGPLLPLSSVIRNITTSAISIGTCVVVKIYLKNTRIASASAGSPKKHSDTTIRLHSPRLRSVILEICLQKISWGLYYKTFYGCYLQISVIR
jgi:hypothetical protein